jgi:hypothetical protein
MRFVVSSSAAPALPKADAKPTSKQTEQNAFNIGCNDLINS